MRTVTRVVSGPLLFLILTIFHGQVGLIVIAHDGLDNGVGVTTVLRIALVDPQRIRSVRATRDTLLVLRLRRTDDCARVGR